MLEQLRRNSRSVIVWVLFGIIIFIFVVSFGPQADEIRCGGQASYAVNVDGSDVQPSSWRYGMNGLGEGGDAQERRQRVIDLLVGRELLAQAAEDAGIRVSEDVANEAIAAGEFYFLGSQLDGSERYFTDGHFDYNSFQAFSRGLGQPSTGALIDEQRREHTANKMRSLLADSVTVSPQELRDRYVRENTTATAEHVSFDASAYERGLHLSDADLDLYLEHYEDEVKEEYDAQSHRYADVGEEVEVRFLRVDFGDDRGEAREATERARERIEGGDDFADVARDVSDDDRTAHRGGYMGWRPANALGLGRAVTDAADELDFGELSEVVESDGGYYVFRLENEREGELDFEDVKHELARDMARPYFARAAAERDAEAALEELRGGASFDELFPSGEEAEGDGELGRATPEVRDVPAELGGEAGPLAQAEEAQGEAADGAPLEGEAEEEILEEGGEAADDGENGAGENSARIPADAIPDPVGISEPRRETIGPVPRTGGEIEGIGQSRELSRALFDELDEGEVAERIFEVDDAFVLIRLVSREEADMEAFEDEADQLREMLALEKSAGVLFDWIHGRCRELTAEGRIDVNPEYFLAETGEATPQDLEYIPCQTLTLEDMFQNLQSRRMPQ